MENVQYVEQSRHGDRYFTSLLIDELENENIDEVKWLLLHKKADPNLVLPNQGFSPMHVLAGFENEWFSVEVIEIALKERGGDPNVRSADGLTPVHLAAIWGRCMVLEILLKFGGDPFLLDYKFSLNAEDLALKEHQWQTHAILATFSVFNDKPEEIDNNLRSSLNGELSKNVDWPNDLSKMVSVYKSTACKEYPLDCWDSTSKDINSNVNLTETEDKPKVKSYQQLGLTQSKSTNSFNESLNFCGNKSFDGKNTMEQEKVQRKKKLSDQFTESFAKFKHFFGRASFPKLSSGNSPKVDSKRKSSKTSI